MTKKLELSLAQLLVAVVENNLDIAAPVSHCGFSAKRSLYPGNPVRESAVTHKAYRISGTTAGSGCNQASRVRRVERNGHQNADSV